MKFFPKRIASSVAVLSVVSVLGLLATFSGCGPATNGAAMQDSMKSDGMKSDGMMKDGMMKDGTAPAGADMKSGKKM